MSKDKITCAVPQTPHRHYTDTNSMNYLWNNITLPTQKAGVLKYLQKSNHAVDELRVNHLSAWIFCSKNPIAAWFFIQNNVEDPFFNTLLSRWNPDECHATDSTKNLRLSTSQPGVLTVSTNYSTNHYRYYLDMAGYILDQQQRFPTISSFMHSLSLNCIVCSDYNCSDTSLTFTCGHTVHDNCLFMFERVRRDMIVDCPICTETAEVIYTDRMN